MTVHELVSHWKALRAQLITSQLGPTFLLTLTVWFLNDGLAEAPIAVRLSAAGILLASGLLGAAVQASVANEGLAVIEELRANGANGPLIAKILAAGPWLGVIRFLVPAIFTAIYVALLVALFA